MDLYLGHKDWDLTKKERLRTLGQKKANGSCLKIEVYSLGLCEGLGSGFFDELTHGVAQELRTAIKLRPRAGASGNCLLNRARIKLSSEEWKLEAKFYERLAHLTIQF